jgi:Arc/MetJ-type ribon-helix-helix transcriptional regulator
MTATGTAVDEPTGKRAGAPGSDVVRSRVNLLAALHDPARPSSEVEKLLERHIEWATVSGELPSLGRVRKVSVSLPEDLTSAVQERVGRGEFSRYVAAAVARQLELDLLAELSELLDAEHGEIPEEFLVEAAATWPDAE